MSQAIESVFPEAEIQNCIIHQIRNSNSYASYKDLKSVTGDLKTVYQALDQEMAERAPDAFSEKWDEKYPQITSSWRSNWDRLASFFKYPPELRRIMYTTNFIEGFNRQLRKVTNSKSVFPSDDSLLIILYLAMSDISAKWGKYRNWIYLTASWMCIFRIVLRGGSNIFA